MKITQIYEFVNSATKEALGQDVVLKEDLSNIVSVGEAVFNANAMDKYNHGHLGRSCLCGRSAASVLYEREAEAQRRADTQSLYGKPDSIFGCVYRNALFELFALSVLYVAFQRRR